MENKTIKNTVLVSVGVGISLLRFCSLLVQQSYFASVMAVLDPVLTIAAGFALGVLFADGSYVPAIVAMLVSAAPGAYVATTSGVGALVFTAMPAIIALCLGLAVRRGTDRSTVVGMTALVCTVMLSASAVLAVYSLVQTSEITLDGLWNECIAQLNGALRTLAESEQFSVIESNYGLTAEQFVETAEKMTDGILRIALLLVPAFAYVLYYFAAFFISYALKPLIAYVKKPPVEELITKNFGGGEVHIHIMRTQPGYDSEFNVSSATRIVYVAALAVLAFGALFGAGAAVTVCAAAFATALTPPFVILGYGFIYRLLRPRLKGATVPVMVLLSIVLSAYSVAVPIVVMFGLTSARFKSRFGNKA